MKVRLLLGLQLLLLGALNVVGVTIAPLRRSMALGVLRKLVDLEKVGARYRVRLWTGLGAAWEGRFLTRLDQLQAGDSLSVDIGGTLVTLVKLRSAPGSERPPAALSSVTYSPGPPQVWASLGQPVCLASVQGLTQSFPTQAREARALPAAARGGD